MLVVETEVYRGRAASQRAMELATVLPHAFGIQNETFTGDAVKLAAATNVFVGIWTNVITSSRDMSMSPDTKH
jgi:DNA helicase II / ATP-dependent DNA helicase PcrA